MKKIKRILLVDDDEVTCYVNRTLLENMEVAEQVECVHNGMQALQYVRGKFIGAANPGYETDLLFLDLKMPVMDGFDFLEEVNKLGNFDRNSMKIIILTSSEDKKDAEALNHYNGLVYCYLTKPLEEKKVKEVIQTIQ